MWTKHPIPACAWVSPCLCCCWPWMSLNMTNTHKHTFSHTHIRTRHSHPPTRRWRGGGQRERESVGRREEKCGSSWKARWAEMGICVWVCFILVRGGGWRLVGGGWGWFSLLMSSIWLTQTQEVARAACLVDRTVFMWYSCVWEE